MKIVTSNQMKEIESSVINDGIHQKNLIERAGLILAKIVKQQIKDIKNSNIIFLIGSGNNGADGIEASKHLTSWGAKCNIILLSQIKANIAKKNEAHSMLDKLIDDTDVIVDAFIGTGNNKYISGPMKSILDQILKKISSKDKKPIIISADLPSGLNADTGSVDPSTINSDFTVSFGLPKIGTIFPSSIDFSGQIYIADIGIPKNYTQDIKTELISKNWVCNNLPKRSNVSHKGNFGKVLILAGSKQYLGAASLAANAAYRSGAGLVTICAPKSIINSISINSIESTLLPLSEDSNGVHSSTASEEILNIISEYDSFLIGCGLGQANETQKMLENILLNQKDLPHTIIDADGLNFLSTLKNSWWKNIKNTPILTPHIGEMSRLAKEPIEKINSEKFTIAKNLADKWEALILLKGAHSVIASHSKNEISISPFANSGLAKAGTGDILSGILAGLVAQKIPIFESAKLATYLHGKIGMITSQKLTKQTMIASDLLNYFHETIKEINTPVDSKNFIQLSDL